MKRFVNYQQHSCIPICQLTIHKCTFRLLHSNVHSKPFSASADVSSRHGKQILSVPQACKAISVVTRSLPLPESSGNRHLIVVKSLFLSANISLLYFFLHLSDRMKDENRNEQRSGVVTVISRISHAQGGTGEDFQANGLVSASPLRSEVSLSPPLARGSITDQCHFRLGLCLSRLLLCTLKERRRDAERESEGRGKRGDTGWS